MNARFVPPSSRDNKDGSARPSTAAVIVTVIVIVVVLILAAVFGALHR